MTHHKEIRLNGLDHLRAFAIVYVFLTHYSTLFPHPKWLEGIGSFGWTGVDLFFVLSGYLIGGQLLRSIAQHRSICISEFYVKRFFRIIPVYLVTLALYFTLPWLRETEGIQPFWKFLTFTQNFGFEGALGRSFSHAWSLCVEEHFYLALPMLLMLLMLMSRWPMRPLAIGVMTAVILAGLTLRFHGWQLATNYPGWFKWVYYPTYNRLDGLLVGVGAASLQLFVPTAWSRMTRQPLLLFILGIGLLFVAYLMCQDKMSFASSVISFPVIALGYGLILVAALSPGSVLHRKNLKLTAFLAVISYSLYLVHKITIHLSQAALGSMGIEIDSGLTFVASIIVSVLAAWALYLGIERPFMEMRSVVLARRRRRSADAGELVAQSIN